MPKAGYQPATAWEGHMRAVIMALAAALLQSAASAADDCQLKRDVSLPMSFDASGHINVPAKLSGHPAVMAVDTGSNNSMLSERAAAAFGLRKELYTASRAWLWGGTRLASYVNVDEFQIGRTIFTKTQLYLVPDRLLPPGVDGIMGADVMSKFDADFDFASHTLNFFNRFHCAGKVVYWTDESQVSVLPFRSKMSNVGPHHETENQILFYVTLDGKDMMGVLDTGATNVRLGMDEAGSYFGLTPQSPGMTPVTTSAGTSYRYTFKSLNFGGVSVANPPVTIDPYGVNKMPGYAPPLLIGMDVISKLHVYVAYQERKVYISAATAH